MDVTNPGLVNVADQAFPPDLRTNSLAIPLDDDILVPVADQGEPRAENDVTSSTFPIPAEEIVARQSTLPVSQDFGEVPGVAPAFLPFPQNKIVNTLENQSIVRGIPNEYTVAGPDESIQTNVSADTIKRFAVTQVLDADTGLPITIPVPATSGTFMAVQDTFPGIVTFVSSTPIPPALTNGLVVSIAGIPSPGLYDGLYVVSNVQSLGPGNFDVAVINIATTGTTIGSLALLPGNISGSNWINITGSTVPAYNGIHRVSNLIDLQYTYTSVANTDPPGTEVIFTTSAHLLGLSQGQLVYLSGSYGWAVVSNVVSISGSIISAADSAFNPGVQTTFTSVSALPGALQAGQRISITGTGGVPPIGYDGIWKVLNVTGNTFDITTAYTNPLPGSCSWDVFNFNIVGTLGSAIGTCHARTFDIDVVNAGTASGVWNVFSFDVTATYVGDDAGTWTYTPPQPVLTSRYKLVVTPADLNTFGVSILGRQILFDDVILTAANEGAARIIAMYGGNYIVINRDDPADQSVPILASPQITDTFTLDVQRQGAEPIFRGTGQTADVTISPLPAVNLPTGFPSENFQGNVDVTVGPQPGEPVITSGVRVPTAINVNVADQDAVIGLPANVFP